MNSLKLTHIARTFGKGSTRLEILKDINLEIGQGEIVALVGPSGSGKSFPPTAMVKPSLKSDTYETPYHTDYHRHARL